MHFLQQPSSNSVTSRSQHNPTRYLQGHSSVKFHLNPSHTPRLHNPRFLLGNVATTLIQHTNHTANATRNMHTSSMHIHGHRQYMLKRQDLGCEALDIGNGFSGIAEQVCDAQVHWIDFCQVKRYDLACDCPVCGCVVDFDAFDAAGFVGGHGDERVAYLTGAGFDATGNG
ncbi:elongation factor EF-1 alpha subunit, partial [Aureobasidium melanogenum]